MSSLFILLYNKLAVVTLLVTIRILCCILIFQSSNLLIFQSSNLLLLNNNLLYPNCSSSYINILTQLPEIVFFLEIFLESSLHSLLRHFCCGFVKKGLRHNHFLMSVDSNQLKHVYSSVRLKSVHVCMYLIHDFRNSDNFWESLIEFLRQRYVGQRQTLWICSWMEWTNAVLRPVTL